MIVHEASIIIGSIQAADYNSGPPTTFIFLRPCCVDGLNKYQV